MNTSRESLIEIVKALGEDISSNADKIIDENFQGEVRVSFRVSSALDEFPTINIDKDLYGDKTTLAFRKVYNV